MTGESAKPKIAIASSGLGHVQRGVEAWASDLANGLRKAGADVTLFGGAPADGLTALPCLRRTSASNRFLTRCFRHIGGWRYGAGSPYDIEQTSFSVPLWWKICHGFDILHVQDPWIASWFETARHLGLSKPRVIYGNVTGEGAAVMSRFHNLQLVTRQAYERWRARERSPEVGTSAHQSVFMIPNFIDTAMFAPGDREAARARFRLPRDKLIVLCGAAIRRFHKRIDCLLTEFATIQRQDVILVVAGGREPDTDEIIAQGKGLLGDRVRFLPDVPRADMPDLYRAADLFVLPSLHEMFGIVLIEAMASGLPVVCHDSPGFRDTCGPSALYQNISVPGELAAGIARLLQDEPRRCLGSQARPWVMHRFSETAIIPLVLEMYRQVIGHDRSRQRKRPAALADRQPS